MSNLDYAVEIFKRGTPLKNGLTVYDVVSFWYLFNNKKSDFYNWYTLNMDNIDKITSNSNFENKLKNYINLPCDQFFGALDALQDRSENINNNTSIPIPIDKRQTVSVLSGGNNDKKKKNFVTGILYFLFSRASVSENTLPIATDYDDVTDIITLKDISGDQKPFMRLIFLLSVQNKQYILKIAQTTPRFKTELDIYRELNGYMETDDKIKDKIIKIYAYGTLNNGITFGINIGEQKISFDEFTNIPQYKKIQHMFSFALKKKERLLNHNKLYYSVQEYNKNYDTLYNALSNLKIIDQCKVIEPTMQLLLYLNQKYGFSHLDLHSDNLLVNIKDNNGSKIKLFDFDFSTTNKNINYYALSTLLPKSNYLYPDNTLLKMDNFDTKLNIPMDLLNKIGFAYDFFRFIQGLNQFWARIIGCNKNLENLRKIHALHKISDVNDYSGLGKIAVEIVAFGDFEKIIDALQPIAQPNIDNQQKGGYYQKYLKYKSKYLQLKSIQ